MSMNSWPQVPLGDVITKSDDRVNVFADQEYPNFGIFSFGRGLFAKPKILGSTSSAGTLFRAKQGQFVYSRLFAFEGAYGVVTDQFDGCFVSNEFPLFDCDPRRILSDYLGWLFRYREIWTSIAQLTTGMGNRRQRVHPEALLGFSVPLPPLDDQRRIVAKVNRLAGKLDEARRTTQQIDSQWQTLLRSKFAQIIAGAPRQRMAKVAPLVRRKVETRLGEEYSELGIRSFGKGTFHKPPLDYLSVGSKKLYRIRPGDLVFNNVFAWEGAIAVARPEDEGRVGSHRFITCVAEEGVATADFLCFYFSTPEGLERIGKASPGGAGRNRTLGLDKLGEIEVPVAPYEKQRRFGRLLAQVHSMQVERHTASKRMDAYIPSILDRAFRGAL